MIGILSFVGFTVLVAVISYYATRKTNENTSDGYFLGGRSLTATVIAGSLLLTNLSTEQIVGLNGSAYKEGILVMAWETLAAIAMVVTAVFLLPRYLKGGITTVPTFLERRYDTTTKALTSALFLTGYAVILLPTVLYSGSLAIMFDEGLCLVFYLHIPLYLFLHMQAKYSCQYRFQASKLQARAHNL